MVFLRWHSFVSVIECVIMLIFYHYNFQGVLRLEVVFLFFTPIGMFIEHIKTISASNAEFSLYKKGASP